MEGLLFAERIDDSEYEQPSSLATDTFEQEYALLLLEESWKNPQEFGHVQSRFEDHVAMLAKQSKEQGIETEYSPELLQQTERIAMLQGEMMSYDRFYQMICACPEDFGMSSASINRLFDTSLSANEWQSGHTNEDNHNHKNSNETNKKNEKSDKKKRRVIGGWLWFLWFSE